MQLLKASSNAAIPSMGTWRLPSEDAKELWQMKLYDTPALKENPLPKQLTQICPTVVDFQFRLSSSNCP